MIKQNDKSRGGNGMDNNRQLAPHETLEVHELLTFKNVCCTKASAMESFVQDEELKKLLQADVRNGQEEIKELKGLLLRNKLS